MTLNKPPKKNVFGKVRPVGHSAGLPVIKVIAGLFVVTLAVPLFLRFKAELIEKDAPQVDFPTVLSLGNKPLDLKLSLRDPGAGLSRVVINFRQNDKSSIVLDREFSSAKLVNEHFTLDAKKLSAQPGSAYLDITAIDSSWNHNTANHSSNIDVDFAPPQVQVLAISPDLKPGGSGIVVFKAIDDSLALPGVKVGERLFDASSAESFDKSFSGKDDIYATLFPIPAAGSLDSIEVYAEDSAGNVATDKVRIAGAGAQRKSLNLSLQNESEESLKKLFAESHKSVLDLARERVAQSPPAKQELAQDQNVLLLTDKLMLQEMGLEGLDISEPRREFIGPFIPLPPPYLFDFADRLQFQRAQGAQFTIPALGIFIPMSGNMLAVQSGRVLGVIDLPPFGKAVAIDHGFGLVSLYSALSSVKVTRGEEVKKGREIGTPSDSGLFHSTGVFLQILARGEPVDPGQWLDERWFQANVLQLIQRS